ncbi:MAG: hypothetical protein ACI30I_06580 [Parabacteroides sp.]
MKTWKFLGAAAAAMMMLSSCLGDSGGQSSSFSNLLGVVTMDNKSFVNVVQTAAGTIYNPDITKMGFSAGDCIQVSFLYDSSNPNNANDYVNGYTYVTITGTPTSIDKGSVDYGVSDTTCLIGDQEIVLDNPIAGQSTGYDFYPNLGGYMFLSSSFEGLTGQKNAWYLKYDMNQTPEVYNNNYDLYTFVLRAVKKEEGKTPQATIAVTNAYNIQMVLERMNQKANSEGKDRFYIQFKYLKSVEEDGTLKWANSAPLTFQTTTTSDL